MSKRSEKIDQEREEQTSETLTFWDLIGRVKNLMEDMEGKWLTMEIKDKNDLTKSFYRSNTKKRETYFIIFYSFVYTIFHD